MRRLVAVVGVLVIAGLGASSSNSDSQELVAYEKNWVGVRAPELGDDAQDRTTGPSVRLKDYRGKRVLLYVLNAGNFVQGPNEKQLLSSLRSLDEVRQAAGDKLAVIGLSESPLFFMEPTGTLNSFESTVRERLTSFPMIAVPNREFPEPYSQVFHRERGGIAVDENGVILKFYNRDLTRSDMQEAVSLPAWKGEPKSVPVTDPWGGRGEPSPSTSPTIAWCCPITEISAITTGDWNGDSVPDVIVCTKPKEPSSGAMLKSFIKPGKLVLSQGAIVILNSSGTEISRLGPPDREFRRPDFICLSETTTSAPLLLACRKGWPDYVPVLRTDGSLAFRYQTDSAVDHASWCDLDGDGESEMLVGYNGKGGIHVVDREGVMLRKNTGLANVWCVGGISGVGGKPGVPMCTDAVGRVKQLDLNLQVQGEITPENQYVTSFAAARDGGKAGEHIVAIETPRVGAQMYAVAHRLDGTELWRYPVKDSARLAIPVPVGFCSNTGSWLVQSGPNEVVQIAADGTLLARIRLSADIVGVSGFVLAQDTYILIADATGLTAYRGRAMNTP